MQRKIRIIILAAVGIVLAAMMCGCGMFSDNTEYAPVSTGNTSSDGFYYDLYENGSATVTGWASLGKVMTIPDKLDGHPVTSIGERAFLGAEYLLYVKLGANLTKIGDEAFSGCSSLVRIDASPALTAIGDSAFYSCTILTEVRGAEKLRTIGENAFFGCSSLTRMTFPETLISIGNQAFFGCASLVSVVLPDKVDIKLGHGAFSYCDSICYASLGGTTEIPGCAFEKCPSLVTVKMSKNVTYIGESAFRACTNLQNIKLGKKIKSIGSSVFDDTLWIDSQKDDFLIVGDGILLRYNGTEANVSIPSGVKVIADAFCGVETLKGVTVGGKVTKINAYAFSGCTNLTRVTISGKVTSIGDNAFASCSSLSSVYLPASLAEVGTNSFLNCQAIATVNYGGNSSAWEKIVIGRGNEYLTTQPINFSVKP